MNQKQVNQAVGSHIDELVNGVPRARVREIISYYLGVPDWNKDDVRHFTALEVDAAKHGGA